MRTRSYREDVLCAYAITFTIEHTIARTHAHTNAHTHTQRFVLPLVHMLTNYK